MTGNYISTFVAIHICPSCDLMDENQGASANVWLCEVRWIVTALEAGSLPSGNDIVPLWWFSSASWLSSVMVTFPVKGHGRLSTFLPRIRYIGIHRDMNACTITSSIGIYLDTHLVTSRVGVEWRTVPFLFRCYVLVEICHFKYTRATPMIFISLLFLSERILDTTQLISDCFYLLRCSLTVSRTRWRWDASFPCCCMSL